MNNTFMNFSFEQDSTSTENERFARGQNIFMNGENTTRSATCKMRLPRETRVTRSERAFVASRWQMGCPQERFGVRRLVGQATRVVGTAVDNWKKKKSLVSPSKSRDASVGCCRSGKSGQMRGWWVRRCVRERQSVKRNVPNPKRCGLTAGNARCLRVVPCTCTSAPKSREKIIFIVYDSRARSRTWPERRRRGRRLVQLTRCNNPDLHD